MYPICRRKSEKRGWSFHLQTPSVAKIVRKMNYFKEKSIMAAKVTWSGLLSAPFARVVWADTGSWREERHYVLSVAVMPQLLLPSVLLLIHIVCHFSCAFFVGCCPVLIFKWLLRDWGIDGHNSMISILFYLEGFSFRKKKSK